MLASSIGSNGGPRHPSSTAASTASRAARSILSIGSSLLAKATTDSSVQLILLSAILIRVQPLFADARQPLPRPQDVLAPQNMARCCTTGSEKFSARWRPVGYAGPRAFDCSVGVLWRIELCGRT